MKQLQLPSEETNISNPAVHIPYLQRCVELSAIARGAGNTPSGALLR
ncbi:hypothetical protein [Paenibacillus harenae]|uniref:Uncharacterized protein n=1 Tax=Paenibacillus harenae TaxID=306543 RepID=A0ABT9U9E9_PAEHA|nr:hypothetical protein [Paenibacillus harenae]MDQ0116284.1 hypothetical protein [Paenibacillus harenae]